MIVVFVAIVNVCSRCERREKELFFYWVVWFLLSKKIQLELLQCFLYLEKHHSNLKKKMEKFCIWRICWSWFLGFVLQKIDLFNLLEMLWENVVFKWYSIYIYIENVVILFESKSFLFLFKRVLFIAKIKIKKKGGKH